MKTNNLRLRVVLSNTKVVGLMLLWTFHLRSGPNDPCRPFVTQNILWCRQTDSGEGKGNRRVALWCYKYQEPDNGLIVLAKQEK